MRRHYRRSAVAATVVVVLIGVAAMAAVTFTGDAAAITQSKVTPLTSAGLSGEVTDGVVAAAASAGGVDVRVVASSGAANPKAGVYVARAARGGELVSFFGPHAFTSFADVRRLLADFDGLFVATDAQPATAGGPTAHVQARGVAAPNVARIEVQRSDGSTTGVELLRLARPGQAYFTYVTDEPSAFPAVFRAYGANGALLGTFDVTRATQPPALDASN